MPQTDITVVIPCFNVGDYVKDAVHSVLNQRTQCSLQIVCVDNGSVDHTSDVLTQIASEFPVLVLEEPRKGAGAARNKGLSVAQGTYVQFLDADDLLQPDKLESQFSFSQMHDSANVAGAFFRSTVDGDRTLFVPDSDPWKGLFTTRFGITSSLLLRTDDVKKAGGWNEDLRSSQEYELIFRMLQNNAVFAVQTVPTTIVRERPAGQISQTDPGKRWHQYLQLRAEIMDYLRRDQPEYFEKESGFFRQAFFDLIRTTYLYAPEVALDFYVRYLGKGFRPSRSAVTGSAYLVLHTLFGFPRADRLRRWTRTA